MLALTEDQAKAWLRRGGFPVPDGAAATSPEAAAKIAAEFGGEVIVKALVPTGRRGKAGAVRFVEDASAAADAAREMLGTEVNGYRVGKVYIEKKVEIAEEYYLSISLLSFPPILLLSSHGGVDIEEITATDPHAVISVPLDATEGLKPWEAIAAWKAAGIGGSSLPKLAGLTSRLYSAFQEADALTLEINPLTVDADGNPSVVGAMLAIDDDALSRQVSWLKDDADPDWMFAGRNLNERERAVFAANHKYRGGMIRYAEFDGDIGLILNGGGAGLLQHDLILSMGGRPANHSDMNGINTEKLKALARAVLDNPNVRGLLVSGNHLQMTRADKKVEPIIDVLEERGIDATQFPVVIRMFGPHEAEARATAARIPGIVYPPTGTSLEDVCATIVDMTRKAKSAQ